MQQSITHFYPDTTNTQIQHSNNGPMDHLDIDQSEAATLAPWGAEPADESSNEGDNVDVNEEDTKEDNEDDICIP